MPGKYSRPTPTSSGQRCLQAITVAGEFHLCCCVSCYACYINRIHLSLFFVVLFVNSTWNDISLNNDRLYICLLSATLANTYSKTVIYVTFQTNSKVTQYPLEHASDYFKMFSITHGMEENDTLQALHDENLTVFEWDYIIPRKLMSAVTVQEWDLLAPLKGTSIVWVDKWGFLIPNRLISAITVWEWDVIAWLMSTVGVG